MFTEINTALCVTSRFPELPFLMLYILCLIKKHAQQEKHTIGIKLNICMIKCRHMLFYLINKRKVGKTAFFEMG